MDPCCSLVHTLCAAMWLRSEHKETPSLVSECLKKAELACSSSNEREQRLLCAVRSWAKGDVLSALQEFRWISSHYPRDLFALKMCQGFHFHLGEREHVLSVVERVMKENKGELYIEVEKIVFFRKKSFFLFNFLTAQLSFSSHSVTLSLSLQGMLAFGLVENERFEEALKHGKHASSLAEHEEGGDPWAHHAVAHVYEILGMYEEGITWMEVNKKNKEKEKKERRRKNKSNKEKPRISNEVTKAPE